MNITRGKVKTAIKMLVYGPEGVGKTTFAAQMPGAVFIDTEGSTKHMDVARFDAPDDLMDVSDQLNYVLGHAKEIGTVVIDTVDWLEKLIF
ncbi:MAG: AAA family ATPase, partial [Oscillospiraceae bacterium]|nr:AAA family ATPase [Oscillospiraceae bacterium]